LFYGLEVTFSFILPAGNMRDMYDSLS